MDFRTWLIFQILEEDIHIARKMSSASQSVELLGQGAGYGILVGVGALFAGGMILTTKLLQRYLHENSNSTETFAVANRSVGVCTCRIFRFSLAYFFIDKIAI